MQFLQRPSCASLRLEHTDRQPPQSTRAKGIGESAPLDRPRPFTTPSSTRCRIWVVTHIDMPSRLSAVVGDQARARTDQGAVRFRFPESFNADWHFTYHGMPNNSIQRRGGTDRLRRPSVVHSLDLYRQQEQRDDATKK